MSGQTATRGSFAAMYEASRSASLDASPRQVKLTQLEPMPNQPRNVFHAESLDELAESIKAHGVLQPLVVRPHPSGQPNRYQIVAGERRWHACKRAGLDAVPVVIKNLTDASCREVALIENLQREDITPLEEAQALEEILRESGMTHRALGERIGKTKAYVEQRVRLLRYPSEVQAALSTGTAFTPGHAKAVVQLDRYRDGLIRAVVASGLSVREAERRSHQIKQLEQAGLSSEREQKVADMVLRPQGLTDDAYQAALIGPARLSQKSDEGPIDLRSLAIYEAIERAQKTGNWIIERRDIKAFLKKDLGLV